MQQGDPLGPLLYALVLQKVVISISKDSCCADLLLHRWYLDDGAIAGSAVAVRHALHILEELGPQLGLHINHSKCELFSQNADFALFPSQMKTSTEPNLVILGVPIGDFQHCSAFISSKRTMAVKLLESLESVGSQDPHVALVLRFCGGFCKLSHIARTTPPALAGKELALFDNNVRQSFTECLALYPSDANWDQAQLSLSHGGLGLRSLALHSPAAYIASLSASGTASIHSTHLNHALDMYNQSISLETPLTVTDVVHTKCCQKKLSSNIEDVQFKCLLNKSSLADKARLLSVSAQHSSSWLSMIPTPGQCLHLDPEECHIAIKWWLGMDTSAGSQCSLCYDHSLDPLGHHATTCKRGGDVVIRHNNIRNILAESFRRAGINVQCEAGSGLSHDNRHTRPADILVPNWFCSRPAALDLIVISPLNSNVIAEAGFTGGVSSCIF